MFSASKTAGPSGYNINNSLRFRGSATAYLSRTPASAGNRKTWTWSAWIKLGTISVNMGTLFIAQGQTAIYLNDGTNSSFRVNGAAGSDLITSLMPRDPSAWYHLVVACDTTQATDTNRLKIYVNGVQQTAFQAGSAYPTLNGDTFVNSTAAHYIGRRVWNSDQQYDGYMAEVNFIDGQALTPSSFGSTNATTGVWQPAKYTGSYGTNGFYLPFSDIGLTSGSNTGLGKDFSGNSNYWTTNNISVTAGTTYDAMTDSPTLTSATVANYAVINPLDFISANGTISSANLNWASSASGCGNRATIGSTSGKWYWEAIGSSVTSGTIGGRFAFTGSDTIAVEQDKFGMYWHPTSGIARIVNGTNTYVTSAYTYTNSDVLALALDLDNNISYWYKNGVLQYTYDFSAYSTIGARVFFPYVWNASSGTPSWVYNFGQRPFSYTPPTGFNRLNTYNLPDSTIKKGNSYFDSTTWTGNGNTSRTITNAASFRPDFVWLKERDIAIDHILYDSIRGPSTSSASKALCSNTTVAEGSQNDNSTYGYLDGFTSSGFTVTRGSDGTVSYTNKNNGTYIGWQWQAGQGSTSSNTSGSITSTVSVNTTAGFSIVTWTGTGSAATVGHGLGVAPKMVISKKRNGLSDWAFWITGFAGTELMELNGTSGKFTGATVWNSTTPTSTVFSVGSATQTNNSGGTYVAYCWAEIAGFSKFGSYTGNGSTDGPFVYLGFRPKFIIIKQSSAAGENWVMYDTVRNTYNVANLLLHPNLSNAESTTTLNPIDILSNGFKLRGSSGLTNTSSATYIYMAFAENPFKNALAR